MKIQAILKVCEKLITFAFCATVLSTFSYSQEVLLAGGRLIIGDGTVIEQGSILMDDGLIVAVSSEVIPVSETTLKINISGKTVIPALIDAHAHLGFQSAASWDAENYTFENIVQNLDQYAYYGFAAVFSAGTDSFPLAQTIQEQQLSGEIGGARFLFAAGMGPPGQGPNDRFLTQLELLEDRMDTQILRGLENTVDAISAAREVDKQGIPFIKVWIDDRGGSQAKLHPDIYKPLVAEAQRLRIKTFAHQQNTADMIEQMEAGIAGFLHGRLEQDFSREIAAASRLKQVFIVPNLGLAELRPLPIGQDEFLQKVLQPSLQKKLSQRPALTELQLQQRAQLELALSRSFSLLKQERAEVILGTDAGAVPDHPFGYTGHKELEIYVRLGYTPMQALMAATSQAAKHLNLSDLGSIAPGFSADLVILSDNPLDSISNTQTIERVFLKGVQVDRKAIATALQTP